MFRALKEERKIKLILNTLQKNMKKLLRRYTTLDDKTGTDKIETADAFLAFAKNDCIEFCTKVYKAFPREIRDTIYGYVTGFEDVYITCHPKGKAHGRMKKVKHVSRLQESELCLGALQDEAEHWWKPEHVGADIVRETRENYYRSSCFLFEHDITDMGRFRVTDQFDFGFLPVEFVTKVQIVIECHDYKFELVDHEGTDNSAHGSPNRTSDWGMRSIFERSRHTQEHLLVELESLFGFRSGTAIDIKLSSGSGRKAIALEEQEWMSHNIVPVIFPVLQRLNDASCRVRILLSSQGRWGPTTFASS
jgi:hypothetical protein